MSIPALSPQQILSVVNATAKVAEVLPSVIEPTAQAITTYSTRNQQLTVVILKELLSAVEGTSEEYFQLLADIDAGKQQTIRDVISASDMEDDEKEMIISILCESNEKTEHHRIESNERTAVAMVLGGVASVFLVCGTCVLNKKIEKDAKLPVQMRKMTEDLLDFTSDMVSKITHR